MVKQRKLAWQVSAEQEAAAAAAKETEREKGEQMDLEVSEEVNCLSFPFA